MSATTVEDRDVDAFEADQRQVDDSGRQTEEAEEVGLAGDAVGFVVGVPARSPQAPAEPDGDQAGEDAPARDRVQDPLAPPANAGPLIESRRRKQVHGTGRYT